MKPLLNTLKNRLFPNEELYLTQDDRFDMSGI